MEDVAPILQAFGQRVRTLRQARNLSQESFAGLCGLDRTYISGVERGVRNLSLVNIQRIAQALDISLKELMRGL